LIPTRIAHRLLTHSLLEDASSILLGEYSQEKDEESTDVILVIGVTDVALQLSAHRGWHTMVDLKGE